MRTRRISSTRFEVAPTGMGSSPSSAHSFFQWSALSTVITLRYGLPSPSSITCSNNGSRAMADSMSTGGTFSPFESTMISFRRPVMKMWPCPSIRAVSPELSQPSGWIIALVASGLFQ